MATRRRQSMKRLVTKAVARTIVYRAVNDMLDAIINHVSEAFATRETEKPTKKKTAKK